MSDTAHKHSSDHDDDEKDEVYKPPKEVGLQDILSMDAEDEALKKYKQTV
jgi:hypothetical protein